MNAPASPAAMLQYMRPDLREVCGYHEVDSAIPADSVRLHANESPEPAAFDASGMNRYPSQQPQALIDVMAGYYGVSSRQILIGRGSDDLIDLLIRACCTPRKDAILISPPTFVMYSIYARYQQAQVISVPLTASFACDVAGIEKALDERVRLVFACTPNNPTGSEVGYDDLYQLAQITQGRSLLVIDEAYAEFTQSSGVRLLEAFDHVVCLRTLSKAHAMAGARLGILLAHPDWVAALRHVMAPYPLSPLVTDTCLQAFSPQALEATKQRVSQLCVAREHLQKALSSLPCVTQVWPSQANFLLVRLSDAALAWRALLDAGVQTRAFANIPSLAECLRISVGTQAQNQRVLDVLAQLSERES